MAITKDTTAPADIQRWSEELARNPASLAFLPLARAYRRQGGVDAATRLCLRGLEQHPMHVEAHALLALLYLESGDRAKAADEWSTVLRLKPGNFEALRGMGFRYLEQGDVPKARQHLERAALIRPMDTAVQEALRLLRSRSQEEAVAIRPSPTAAPAASARAGVSGPFSLLEREAAEVFGRGRDAETSVEGDAEAGQELNHSHTETRRPGEGTPQDFSAQVPVAASALAEDPLEAAPAAAAVAGETSTAAAEPSEKDEPTRVFDALLSGGPVTGVLLLDNRGFVLAGRLTGAAEAHGDEVGALIGGTSEEVARAIRHLDLQRWRGTVLECGRAVLHVSPAQEETVLVVALRRDTPHGWIVRAATQAASLATAYLGRMG